MEIVDPAGDTVLPDGVTGEVVISTLMREGMPLIRYRTGDLARLLRTPCACGAVGARLDDIRGRDRIVALPHAGELTSRLLDDQFSTFDPRIPHAPDSAAPPRLP